MDESMQKNVCGCPHHRMIPLLVVLFAIVFLLGAFDVLTQRVVSISWPVIVGVAGLMKLGESRCKCC